jgi:transcriptional regulator with XRE-family HTH domain
MGYVDKIRAERVALRCSQITISKMVGISRYRLSLFECGYKNLTRDEISRIRKILSKLSLCKKRPLFRARVAS